jgi:two-component system response regulator YesN
MSASLKKAALVEHVIEMIRAHYAEPVTLRQVAAGMGRHPNYVGLVFHEQMGLTVRGYLTRFRLERAADLIARGDKIEAVSLCVGYRSKRNFYRQFKRCFGMTPQQYRRALSSGPVPARPGCLDGMPPSDSGQAH